MNPSVFQEESVKNSSNVKSEVNEQLIYKKAHSFSQEEPNNYTQILKCFNKNQMNIEIANLKLQKQSNEFQKSDHCSLCQQIYSSFKFIFENNCQYCGSSVCGECSKRTINKFKVCDFCFLKKSLKTSEERRKNYLKTKDKKIIQMKKEIQLTEEEVKSSQVQLMDLQNKNKEIVDSYNVRIQKLKEEIDQLDKTLEKTLANNERLSQAVQIDQQLLDQLNQRYKDLQQKNFQKKNEIEVKKKKIEEITNQIEDLKKVKKEQEQSKSFLQLTEIIQNQSNYLQNGNNLQVIPNSNEIVEVREELVDDDEIINQTYSNSQNKNKNKIL